MGINEYDELMAENRALRAERDALKAENERSTEYLRETLRKVHEEQKGLAVCSWCALPTNADPESKGAHQMTCPKSPLVARVAQLETALRRARGVLADIINAEDERREAAWKCFDEGLIDRDCADDCPQDDTCDCPGTTLIGKAVNRRNFHEGDCLRALDVALSRGIENAQTSACPNVIGEEKCGK